MQYKNKVNDYAIFDKIAEEAMPPWKCYNLE